MTVDAGGHSDEPFFRHAPLGADSAGLPMQNDTRYLSAAVYLDQSIGDRVIAEYIDEEHRGVVPSFGFDLRTVVLHALRARRLRLYRDLILAAVWMVTFILVPAVAGPYFVLALVLSVLSRIPWRRPKWIGRILVGGALLYVGFWGFGALRDQDADLSPYEQVEGDAGVRESLQAGHVVLLMLLLTLVMGLVVIGHRAAVQLILSRDLAPEALGPGPRSPSDRVQRLLERIGSAQLGNVTLYSGENPFIGAGEVTRVWSIVLELDRAASGLLTKRPQGAPARVDPVVMHQRVRARLQEMRDEWPPRAHGDPPPGPADRLPPNERIAGLVTGEHVVGRGVCTQRRRALDASGGRHFDGHPLIDARAGGVPFSVATPAAIDAIMRHPQGGVRCYQRVTVGARGQAIMGGDRPLAPAEDQDIALSTFLYLAVEGRMLYGQFVATVLPPIRGEFRVVDLLPDWSVPRIAGHAAATGWRDVLSGMLLAWPRAVRTLGTMAQGAFAASAEGAPAARMVHDYGARISVRELASESGFETFLQELDADKYTRLIERRVNEALLDHLRDECGVDVSAYRDQAEVIMNEGVIMTGGSISGQVAVGSHARQSQRSGDGPRSPRGAA